MASIPFWWSSGARGLRDAVESLVNAQAMFPMVALFAEPKPTLNCESSSRKLTSRGFLFSTLQCPRLKASNSPASASAREVMLSAYSVVFAPVFTISRLRVTRNICLR